MADFFKFLHALREVIFPLACVSCGEGGTYCCRRCLSQTQIQNKVLHICNRSFFSSYSYANPLIRKLIHDLKYQQITSVRPSIEKLIEYWALSSGHLIPENCVLVPVPLHRNKLAKRGFNQSLMIAESMGKILDLPVVENLLLRRVDTPSQTSIDNRAENVAGAFYITHKIEYDIFIIDDVITSGATIEACITALEKMNIPCVGGFSLAWGASKKHANKNSGI